MAQEIERKFLVNLELLGELNNGCIIKQGYMATLPTVVRVRLMGDSAFLTVKGRNSGISRTEFDYPIPVDEANEMLSSLCEGPIIEKTRYLVEHQGHTWEVDIFEGDNTGLVVAEVELASEAEHVDIPLWASSEVSDDVRYYNSNLLSHPFSQWVE